MRRTIPADDLPDTARIHLDRFDEIARTLATDALSEIEDVRGFPFVDREAWEALRAKIAADFTDTMARAYGESLRMDSGAAGATAAMCAVDRLLEDIAAATSERRVA